jgi:hypothetical protein
VDPSYTPYILFFLGLIVTLGGGYLGFVRKMDNRVTIVEQQVVSHEKVIESITSLIASVQKVSTDNETFWKILGPHLAGIIHSPRNRERDELVDKFVHGELSDEEGLSRLVDLLHEAIYSGRWAGDKKLAGALLLARSRSQLEATHREAKWISSDT